MSRDAQDREQVRRIVVNVVLGGVVLAVLACVLWFSSMGSLESTQRANAASKLATAHANVAAAQADADDLYAQADERAQQAIDTLAYFYNRNDVSDARFTAMAQAWQLEGLYMVDGSDKITVSSDGAVEPDTSGDAWKALVSDGVAYTDGDVRYYSAHVSGNTTIVGAADVTFVKSEVAQLTALEETVGELSVGIDGYIMAVTPDGTIAYDRDEALVGTAASQVFSQTPSDGFDGYVEFRGQRYYVQAVEQDGYTMVALVAASEFTDSAFTKTVVVTIAFAAIAILILCYCQFLYSDARKRTREGRTVDGSFKRLGKKYVVNMGVLNKSLPILVVGTIGVFLVSWYAQNLVSLSTQIVHNEHKTASIEAALADNEGAADRIESSYSTRYVAQAQAIAKLLAADPSLIGRDYLEDIAERDGLESIYVFDENGQTVATSTTRYDYALPEDKEDQSYGFWNVVKGYDESHIQDVRWSDGTGVTYFVGVPRLDAKGMVEIGVSSTTLTGLLKQTEFTAQLDAIPVGNGGFLLAVDGETHAVSYARDAKFIGQDFAAQGLTEAALSDSYLGYQVVNGTECLVSVTYDHGSYILVCVPTSRIGSGDLVNALVSAALSFVLLLPCILQLVIQRKRSGKDAARVAQATSATTGVLAQPKGSIEVTTPSGRKSTRSVSGRWSSGGEAWADKTPGGKLATIVRALLLLVTVLVLVYVYAFQSSDSSSALSYIVSMQWEKAPNIFSFTYIGVLVLTAAVAVWALRLVVSLVFRTANARVETVGRLLSSFIKYAVWIGVLFFSLSLIGVDSASLWASAGIVTLIIGLGAQKLINDVIAGIFLVFEGEIRVGDIVTVGGWTGTVLEIGIRTTKIEDGNQNIKVFNNSSVADVVNMTKKYSLAVVDLTVSYETPLEKLEALLKDELPHIAHRLPKVVAGPFYKGVVSVGGSSLVVRIVAQCTEADRGQLERDLTRQLLLVCDHNDVAPYKGAGEYFAEEVVATPEERKAAAEFVKQQGDLG